MLGKRGNQVSAVASGEDALNFHQENAVDVVVLEIIIDSGMDGCDIYRSMLDRKPGQKAIIASGYCGTDRVRAVQQPGAGADLQKPYLLENLALALRRELDRPAGSLPTTPKRMIDIRPCTSASDFAAAIEITKAYLQWLDMDLAFQGIDQELSTFDSMYAPPGGRYLLASYDGQLAGGGGLRALEPGICEMKRLFVYDRFKQKNIGRRLCDRLIQEARAMGYRKIRLDTLSRMTAALSLYKAMGFVEIGPYRYNPDPTARYLERRLV
jgi:GNAT superfamily N-acetyltransferase/CheY-like chemotaxis protein